MSNELKEIRHEIDRLDFDLVNLLKKRMELGLKTKKYKSDVADKERENEILAKILKQVEAIGLIEPAFVRKVFEILMSESKKLQSKGLQLAGFQGEHGAYGEVAARTYNKDLVYIPCLEFADVFESVKNGYLDYGLLPVENSLGGSITQVNELLLETELKIVSEIKIPVHHCLLTLPGTDYKDIKSVYSHPQAISQCRNFLQRNNLQGRPFYDTAGAAKMLNQKRPEASAAIASRLCAELYNLDIIKENIEDHAENSTRFLVLSRNGIKGTGNKCSIIFSIFSAQHKAGSLFQVLKLFSDENVNLTRIESMPRRDDPGNYMFFLDFDGTDEDPKIQKLLEKVMQSTEKYKFLGSYKGAK